MKVQIYIFPIKHHMRTFGVAFNGHFSKIETVGLTCSVQLRFLALFTQVD